MAKVYLSACFIVVICTAVSASSCGLENIRKDSIDSTKICCNGQIHAIHHNGRERDCCTNTSGIGKMFYIDEGRCCNGTYRRINPNVKQDEPTCCGNELIMDHSEELCCGNKPYPSNKYICDQRSMYIDIPLERHQVACYEKTHPADYKVYTNKGYECCGNNYFNPLNLTHECLDEELVPRNRPGICGGREFNKEKFVCCEKSGETIPIPDNVKFNNVPVNGACIKGEFVDNYQVEVLDRLGHQTTVPRGKSLCGNAYYDDTITDPKASCCDDVLNYNVAGSDVQCCGNVTIDRSERTCCNNKIYPLKTKCCGGVTYDGNHNLECCENQLINRRTHMCCGVKKYGGMKKQKTTDLDDECCELTPYNSGKKSCCGQNVVDHWNTATHTCVGNQVRKKAFPTTNAPKAPTLREVINIKINATVREDQECLGCPTTLKPDTSCTKRYEFRFFVLNRRKGTMNVVLLSPKSLEGIRLTLRSRDLCPCVKEDLSYSIYTNRDYRRRILDQEFSLSFSGRDIITPLSMDGSRMKPVIQCNLYRFHKENRS